MTNEARWRSLFQSRRPSGRLTKRVVDWLQAGVELPDERGRLYVVVDTIELGRTFTHEELRLGFHVSMSPAKTTSVRWLGRDGEPNQRSRTAADKHALLYFTFTSEMTFDENLADFRNFVAAHANRSGTPPEPAETSTK